MKTLIVILAVFLALSQAAIVGGYKEIDKKEVETSQNLKSLLDFGTEQFIRKASEENKLSDPKLTLSKINHVYSQVVAGMNYKFDVEYNDSLGKSVFATLIVFYQPWTNTKELTSYEINDKPSF